MKLEDRRVLVVGGAGLVGSHLVDLLLNEPVRQIFIFDNFVRGKYENLSHALQDSRVEIIQGDIRKYEEMREAMEGVDYVFHLAALWLLECLEKPREALQVNVNGTFNVAEACKEAGVKKLIFSSSASVYGNAVYCPMDENHPLNNRTFYGGTKISGEQILRSFHEMCGLNYVALRYFNIYGPRQDYRGAYTSVIMKILDRIEQNRPPVIYGDGSQAYDFIYVTDVALANLLALRSNLNDETINVATGEKTSINTLVKLLLELTGSELKPTYRPAAQVFVTDRVAAVDKAKELLGFQAKVKLRRGLEELIQWRNGHRRDEKRLRVEKESLVVS